MDLKTYFQLFWVPAIASAALMTLLWAQDGLTGRAPLFLASWFLLALAAQYLGTPTKTSASSHCAQQTRRRRFRNHRRDLVESLGMVCVGSLRHARTQAIEAWLRGWTLPDAFRSQRRPVRSTVEYALPMTSSAQTVRHHRRYLVRLPTLRSTR